MSTWVTPEVRVPTMCPGLSGSAGGSGAQVPGMEDKEASSSSNLSAEIRKTGVLLPG